MDYYIQVFVPGDVIPGTERQDTIKYHEACPAASLPSLRTDGQSNWLVLPGGLLASLQLLHVPAADGHVALVLVHAVGEALDVRGTGARGLVRAALAVQGIGAHGVAGVGVCVGGGLCLLGWC